MTKVGSSGSPPEPPHDAEEVERLRAEIARLRGESTTPAGGRRRGWWRPVVAGLLIAVAALLAPVSVLATWASGQIEDTDRYLETVAPLASDPAVQDAIAARVEEVVFSYLDLESATAQVVEALNEQGLPPRVAATLDAASVPLATAIRNFVADRIRDLVRSDAFEQAWVQANRTAHSELVAALLGKGGDSVTVDRGSVNVNLAVIINTVKQQLTDSGFGIADRIPEVEASFTIVESKELSKVQKLLGFLDDLVTWIPVVGLSLLALAIMVARDRRRTVLAAGLAVAASMLLLGAILNIIRPFYLDALPASSSPEAAGVVYDQLVSFIRFALRGLLVVALAIAIAAWLSASTGAGAAARRGISRAIAAVRSRGPEGLQSSRVAVFLAEYRTAVRVGLVGTAALVYLLQAHPTGGTAITLVIATVVGLLIVELLAAARSPSPAAVGKSSED